MPQLSDIKIKICGIKTPDAMTAALEEGADFVGLVFASNSPRYLDIEVASYLSAFVPGHVQVAGLFVDPTERQLEETIQNVHKMDFLQFHGKETPENLIKIREKTGKKIIKALSIRSKEDISHANSFENAADWLILDAAPLKEGDPAGGSGRSFDWSLLEGFQSTVPWMLAGGLTPENVAAAIQQTSPPGVDVSSGVERVRGEKDPDKIRAFIRAVRAL